MSEEQFTPEEQAALEAMEADTGEDEATTEQPEPEEAPEQPGTQEETTDEPEGGEPEPKRERPPEGFVPHGALHAERGARKKLAAELEELKAWREAQEKPAEKAPEYVDPLEDPEGFRRWAEYSQSQTKEQIEREQQARQAEQQRQQRIEEATRLEREFMAKTDDYADAVQFLGNQRVSELRAQGYGDQEISQTIQKDADALFDAARQMNMNPAELLYYRARSAGYTGSQAKQEEQRQSEAQKITAQEKARTATQSLGHGGGEQQSGGLTASALAEMSDAEFAKLERENPDAVRKAMGG